MRQEQILSVLSSFVVEHRYAPTLDEIGNLIGLAGRASVHAHVTDLRAMGLVTWVDGQIRTLALTDAGRALV